MIPLAVFVDSLDILQNDFRRRDGIRIRSIANLVDELPQPFVIRESVREFEFLNDAAASRGGSSAPAERLEKPSLSE